MNQRHLSNEESRILELESAFKDILNSNNLETIKTIAAQVIGELPEDYIEEEDFIYDDYEELNFDE